LGRALQGRGEPRDLLRGPGGAAPRGRERAGAAGAKKPLTAPPDRTVTPSALAPRLATAAVLCTAGVAVCAVALVV